MRKLKPLGTEERQGALCFNFQGESKTQLRLWQRTIAKETNSILSPESCGKP